jgi:hypothetical protein
MLKFIDPVRHFVYKTDAALYAGSFIKGEINMKKLAVIVVLTTISAAWLANATEYKKNMISGTAGTTKSTFRAFSSSTFMNGSNMTTAVLGTPSTGFQFGDFNWGDRFERKTLDQRIRDAEQRLYKLYFIRDVCRTLEDEISISFEKKDIREVMKQVSKIKGVELPFKVPEGIFIIEKSNVSGMPTDQFLNSIANVCGLQLKYERDKLVFVKQVQKKTSGIGKKNKRTK